MKLSVVPNLRFSLQRLSPSLSSVNIHNSTAQKQSKCLCFSQTADPSNRRRNLLNCTPNLSESDREFHFCPVTDAGGFSGYRGSVPASSAAVSYPTQSPGIGNHSMESFNPDLKNSQSHMASSDRDPNFSHNVGRFSDHRSFKLATDASNSHSMQSYGKGTHSLGITDFDLKNSNPDLAEYNSKSQSLVNMNISNPILSDGTSEKRMETDSETVPNQNERHRHKNNYHRN